MYYDVVKSGERIKRLRKLKGLTQMQLSEEIGVSMEALRKLENGRNGTKIDNLLLFAEYFQVTLDYLVAGRQQENVLTEILAGCTEAEKNFIYKMVEDTVKNLNLMRG